MSKSVASPSACSNPIKRWKLSPMDLEARKRWVEYSKAKDVMLAYTDRKKAPWFIIDADDKKRARLNCIAHLLTRVPYKDLHPIELELPPRQEDTGYKRPKCRVSAGLTSSTKCPVTLIRHSETNDFPKAQNP